MKPRDPTVLLMWCCPWDPRCPRLRGLSLQRLFDVKVKERSLYSTGSRALAWPVIAYDQRSITHFLEMGSGSAVICHFKLICTFGFCSDETTSLSFNFQWQYITINTLLESFSQVILYTLICISRCISLQAPGMGSGVFKGRKKNAEYRIAQCVREHRGTALNFLWASSLPVASPSCPNILASSTNGPGKRGGHRREDLEYIWLR